ncbi:hypothetical protein CMO91_04205 [Candidatus Woesearchaeota archaeon]|nr:hypothetical protein [Candidatus Woesearchaeota archaeon]|tara:strand:+ start:209 stop:499 length:291 start_codon:yes stop_codon:yes gene_type:complete
MPHFGEYVRKYWKTFALGTTTLVLSNILAYKTGQMIERVHAYRTLTVMAQEVQAKNYALRVLGHALLEKYLRDLEVEEPTPSRECPRREMKGGSVL